MARQGIDARAHGAVNVKPKGQQHANHDARLQVGRKRQRQHERGQRHDAIVLLRLPGLHHRPHLDQSADRHDDDDRQGRLRQVVEQRRQQQQRQPNGGAGDHCGKAGDGAGLDVHRRTGERAGDGIALKAARREIAKALPDQFLVGVKALSRPHGHRLSDGYGFHETDQGNRDGDAQQLRGRRKVHLRPLEAGQPLRDAADHFAAGPLKPQAPRRQRRDSHRDEHVRQVRRMALDRHDHRQRQRGHADGGPVRRLQRRHRHLPDGVVVLLRRHGLDAEQLSELRRGNDDGGGIGEAEHHGVRQEGDHEAQADDAECQLHQPHQQRQGDRVA